MSEEERARLADTIASRLPSLRRSGADRLLFAIGAARVHILVDEAGATDAFARTRHASLRYRIEGALGDAADECRRVLGGIAQQAAAIDGAIDDDPAAALAHRWLPPSLRIAPSRFVDAVAAAHRARAIAGDHGAVEVAGLAPCLALAQRPIPPAATVRAIAHALPAPCDACAPAPACPANEAATSDGRTSLRPLRHATSREATRAAIAHLATLWNAPVPSAFLDLVDELADDRDVPEGARVPFEVSLKVAGDALLPRLRLVAYAPDLVADRVRIAEARGARLVAIASRLAPAAPVAAWHDLVARRQPAGWALSLGIEQALDGGPIAPQLYAHVEPRDRDAMRTLLDEMPRWCGAPTTALGALLDAREGARRGELVLAGFAPTEREPRRAKLYVAAPLGGVALGSLAPFAPTWGLAVHTVDRAGVRPHKHDFPSTAHFQVARPLTAAFAAGLEPASATRVARFLDGERFAPWPTWLSVSPGGRALYLVPR